MNQNFYKISTFALLLTLIALIFLLGKLLLENRSENYNIIEHKIDTHFVIRNTEPITIEKVRTKIKYRTDTIIKTMPFIATLDTIINKDTIKANYSYPENLIDLHIKKNPDTMIIQTVQIRTENILRKQNWWEKPLIFISGATLGYILSQKK